MKLLLSLLPFLLYATFANAQGNPGREFNEPNYFQNNTDNEALRSAGDYLIKHSRQYYLGWALVGGGYVLTIASTLNQNEVNPTLLTLGLAGTITGIVFQVISHRQIGKAGHMLKRASLSHNLHIQGSSTGAGLALAYKF